MTHIAFPSLEQFSSIFYRETYDTRRSVTFGAKIKLHGTNIAIRVEPNGTVMAQSRKHDITPDNDQNTFATWLEPHKPLWAKAAICQPLTFFGEWAGPGINKGDAVQQTDRKRFYIFAVGVGTMPHPQTDKKVLPAWMITEPKSIKALLPDNLNDDVIVLPWESHFTFDFTREDTIEGTLEKLNAAVDAIAEVDPYIERTFGISHPGEGLVLVEMSDGVDMLSGEHYSRTSFKAKTEKHRVRKQKKPAQAKAPLPPGAHAFADAYVTPARLEQAINEICPNGADIKKTGAVLHWMLEDIEKEGQEDLRANGLTMEMVSGPVTDAIKTAWFKHL